MGLCSFPIHTLDCLNLTGVTQQVARNPQFANVGSEVKADI